MVDDEPVNIMALEGMIAALQMPARHRVDKCFNGEDAVALVQQAIAEGDPNRYTLILTDISMPYLDGCEATKRIRQSLSDAENENLYVVAVTGHSDPEFVKKAMDHGIQEVIPKPITAAQLGSLLVR